MILTYCRTVVLDWFKPGAPNELVTDSANELIRLHEKQATAKAVH